MKQLQQKSRQDNQDQDISAAILQLRIKEQKNVLAVLNHRQRQKWRTSLGSPIDVRKMGRVKFKAPEFWDYRTGLTLLG